MAVASARNIVNLKEKGRFELENARINKYTLADKLPEQVAEHGIKKIIEPAYHVRVITAKDKDRTIDFLRRFFFRDEPMNLAVNLLETPTSRCIDLEEYAASSLDQGVSLAAVDDNGEFVGVVINAIINRDDVEEDKTEECTHHKFKRILRLLTHLSNEAKVWEKVPASCNVMMELRIASTHPDWRGRRIMKVLAEESERLAKSHGAGAIRMDATSAFSARAAERLGYKKVYSVLYKDLPDAPQPKAPHFAACVFIKPL
ncbi:arylalkylamine N-acetyltransferase 1 isoform X1 [Spodoptera frugiperda]|uniref:aralkylamine N-acetyltransferase n=1 Tax=Spodoptera frugiperda TaxID=7108 RepID=A0A9R0DMA3_SPOFR|nr:arylalkylamine N-acetyltransferase 1 isoform X1 [Spodoptera frugiperda]XP_050549998.1 arylalkylamine N-acetyltransferase 1 isoform X1 [Spodoptera frugiperda]